MVGIVGDYNYLKKEFRPREVSIQRPHFSILASLF